MIKKIALLGASGSIGENTQHVIEKHPDKFELFAIAGCKRYKKLAAIAEKFHVKHVAIGDQKAYAEAQRSNLFSGDTKLYCGENGLSELATLAEVKMVIAAIVGTKSLKPVMAAIEARKDIGLASKEILVMAGKFVMAAAHKNNVSILPIDSEHNAIFQCLQSGNSKDLSKIILTASGGAFRNFTLEQMAKIKPEDAIQHPNWDMGPKITVDSSTMANKGLELIEAHWLFNAHSNQIEIVVHPQSIVHSMVEWQDGSVIAQLSPPSMTFAIQHVLTFPEKFTGVDKPIDFTKMFNLEFLPPDLNKFPCLRLAREALISGGTASTIFNAANEIAVDAFLKHQIPFTGIAKLIEKTMSALPHKKAESLDEVIDFDDTIRKKATELI